MSGNVWMPFADGTFAVVSADGDVLAQYETKDRAIQMAALADRWRNGGPFQTLEGSQKTIWIDCSESHPFRGVYLADQNAPLDVFGNPMGLREAPVGAFQEIGRI